MPLPLSTAARNAINAREVAFAWFVELHCDEGVLRGWDQFETITYGGQTYEPLGSTFSIVGELKAGGGLVAESLTVSFDGGGQYDDASFVGRLLDRSWHQRRIKIWNVCFDTSSNFVTAIGTVLEWYGYMDTIDAPEGSRGQSQIILNCESGTFRARARNLRTLTDVDQKLRDATDASFRNIAVKPFQDVPFGISWANIPGVVAGGSAGVSVGGRNGGGGLFNSEAD